MGRCDRANGKFCKTAWSMGKVVLGLREDPDMIHLHLPLIHVVDEFSPEGFVCNLDVFVTDRGLYVKHSTSSCDNRTVYPGISNVMCVRPGD